MVGVQFFRPGVAHLGAVLLSCVVAFLALRARGDVVEADGYGKTEREAEYDAVVQAVRRVTGVNIAETETWKAAEVQSSVSTDGQAQSQQVFVEGLNKEQKFNSKGRVKGWECVSVVHDERRNRYKAHVSVDVAKYSAPDGMPNDQRKIIVLPFETQKGAFKVVTKKFELAATARKLAEKLNDYITQTRKFAVLDRRYDRDVDNELLRIESRNASADDLVQLGNKLATDYMIVGDLRIMDKTSGLDNIAETQKDYAMLMLHYRIILSATTQVKWSDTITVPASAAVGETEEECVENLLDEGARQLHLAVVESIYPIKLADIIDDDPKSPQFILNRGGRGMKVGDTFSLLKLGREILDPDSGEILERRETILGKIRIVRVQNKTSHAVLEDGSPVPSLKAADFGNVVVRRTTPVLKEVGKSGKSTREPTEGTPAKAEAAPGKRLADLRLAQYSELEKALYKMRTGNFTGKSLGALYNLRKEAPNGEIKGLVEKIVGAGLVALGDYKSYNRIKKNIEGARLLESKMKDRCSSCSGSGNGRVSCPDCSGRGKCRNCNGVGYRVYTPRGSFASVKVACNRCGGENLDSRKASSGQCVRCDGTGKIDGECRKCSGTGKIASSSAAEKLALNLIAIALDEFAIIRGEKERSRTVEDAVGEEDESMTAGRRRRRHEASRDDGQAGAFSSAEDDSDDVPAQGNGRGRRSRKADDNAFGQPGDFGRNDE